MTHKYGEDFNEDFVIAKKRGEFLSLYGLENFANGDDGCVEISMQNDRGEINTFLSVGQCRELAKWMKSAALALEAGVEKQSKPNKK